MLQIFPRDDRSLEGQWGSYWVSGVSKPEANGLPTPSPRGSLDPHPLLWSHYPACLSLWQRPTGLCLPGQQGKSACIPVLALGIPVGKGLLGLNLWVDLKEAYVRASVKWKGSLLLSHGFLCLGSLEAPSSGSKIPGSIEKPRTSPRNERAARGKLRPWKS